MGKVVLDITMSLDGFIAEPNEEIDPLHDWIFAAEAGDVTRLTESGPGLLNGHPKLSEQSLPAGELLTSQRVGAAAIPFPRPYLFSLTILRPR